MKIFFLHFFSITSSSRHEKRCRMSQRNYCLFQCSRNYLWIARNIQDNCTHDISWYKFQNWWKMIDYYCKLNSEIVVQEIHSHFLMNRFYMPVRSPFRVKLALQISQEKCLDFFASLFSFSLLFLIYFSENFSISILIL